MSKGIGKGWHYKYPEHALAAKGIRTKIKKTYFHNGKKLALPSYAVKGKTYTMNGKKNTFLLIKGRTAFSIDKKIPNSHDTFLKGAELTSDYDVKMKQMIKGNKTHTSKHGFDLAGFGEGQFQKFLKDYNAKKRTIKKEVNVGTYHNVYYEYQYKLQNGIKITTEHENGGYIGVDIPQGKINEWIPIYKKWYNDYGFYPKEDEPNQRSFI